MMSGSASGTPAHTPGAAPQLVDHHEVIIIASAPWEHHGKLNCHQIAERLASSHRVLYVESPGLRRPHLRHGPDLRKLLHRGVRWGSNLFRGPLSIHDRLHVISPAVLPSHGGRRTARLNQTLFGSAIARAARRLGFRNPLLWVFLPTGMYAVRAFPARPVIYHCVDDYAGNPGVNISAVESLEAQLLERADLVLATSQPLAQRLSAQHAHVHCVPNVAETERFSAVQPEPPEFRKLPRPLIGYVGNLAGFKLDTRLIAELAAGRPEWSFVFIGQTGAGDPSTDLSAWDTLPNVHRLGPRQPEAVPAFVQHLDVCLIPFRRHRVTEGSLPLKTFEYLAAGRPVISTPIAALTAEGIDDVVHFADDAPGFIRAIESALAEDSDSMQAARRAVAARYTWTSRFPEIIDLVNGMLERRAAVGALKSS